MCGLAAVGTAGIDVIRGANRNVDFLLQIAIEIADEQADRSVGVSIPAFVCRGDALARFAQRLERQLLRAGRRRDDCRTNYEEP